MFRLLTRIGKQKWAEFVMPTVTFSLPASYMIYHLYGVHKYREMISIKDGTQERQITGRLKQLLDEVIEETKSKIHQPITISGKRTNPIEFFLSVNPFYGGATESNPGCIIGLPRHLEYESANDVPAEQLELTYLPFFKVKSDKADKDEGDEQERKIQQMLSSHSSGPKKVRIDLDTEDGKKYLNSLILSDDAKKFLIARQMFYCDTFQFMFNFTIFALCGALSFTFPRLIVSKVEPMRRHIARRIPLYLMTAVFTYLQCILMKDLAQFYYDDKSDRRAASINRKYLQGGIEYYTKCIQRNLAIRAIHTGFANNIDEQGNIKNMMISPWRKEMPLTDRLKQLLEILKEKDN